MKNLFKNVPKHTFTTLLIILIVNLLVYYTGILIGETKPAYYLAFPIDEKIPLFTPMVIFYVGSFLFWYFNYFLCCRFNKESAYRFMLGEVSGKLICYIFYVFLPTTMNRPEIIGNNLFDEAVELIYSFDKPLNLFPSLHCYASWICYLGIKDNEKIPVKYKRFCFIFCILIFMSTVMVKQHVFIDIIGGVILAQCCHIWSRNCKISLFEKDK